LAANDFFFTYTMKFRRGEYRVFVRRPGGRLTRSSLNNIKIDIQEVGWGGMDWIDMAQDRRFCMP